jgi:protein SCO1/2
MQKLRLFLWLVVAVVLFVLGAVAVGGFAARNGSVQAVRGSAILPGAPLGGAFRLVDNKGQPVTEAVFRGKPSAVLFGFTHCPDVCPTTLMEMTDWAGALGPEADRMRFVFVTVDPERDTPEVLNNYVGAFSERIIAITGEPEKVRAMVTDHKVFSRKVPLEGGDYSMDHTASVLLLDETGGLVGTIARGEDREAAVAKLKNLVAG